MSSESPLTDAEGQLPELRAAYERATAALIDLGQKQTKRAEKERHPAFHAWHAAGTALFNAHDRVIAEGSLKKLDQNAAWYTDRSETSANLLQTICQHYRTLREWAEDLGIDSGSLRPSLTAFANMQRLVRETHPSIANTLRDEFVRLDLPTHGFDTGGSEKPEPHVLERRFFLVGVAWLALAFGLGIAGFVVRDLSPDQRMIFRAVISLASGFSAWSFSGTLSVTGKHPALKVLITATGGFGVWILTHFLLP